MTRVVAWWLATALMVVGVGCGSTPSVSSPPVAHTAEEAVQLYLVALLDGRPADAEALMAPEALERGLEASWRAEPPPLSEIVVAASRHDGDFSSRYPQYAEARHVGVTFHLDDFSTSEGFLGGDTWWGYIVVRQRDGGSWLILSAGPV